jgi:hypothetical protein
MLADLPPAVLPALLAAVAVLLLGRAVYRLLKGRNTSCHCAEKLKRNAGDETTKTS